MIPSLRAKTGSFDDYFNIVKRRIWIVIMVFVLATGYGILAFLVSPDTYRAKTTIAISQKIFLRSRTLAEKVIKSLNLGESPEKLLSRVTVAPQKGSNLIDITASDKDPARAANIANMWIKEYVDLIAEKKSAVLKRNAADLEEQLSDVSRGIVDTEMTLNEFSKKNPAVAQGENRIKNLEQQASQVEKDIQALSTQYSMDHPKMSFLESQLETFNKQLAEERDKLAPFREQSVQYRELQGKIESQRKTYSELFMRIQKIQSYTRMVKPDIQIIDRALVPEKPLPKGGKIPGAAGIGLVLGVFICFVLEYLDTTLKQAEEVQFYAKMPFLGYIPSVKNVFKNKKKINLFVHLKPDSQAAEAFRNVKVALIFASPEEKFMKTIGVTSSVPGEGKSFVASNLAISFARANENTLLIDSDMRQRGLMGSFETEKETGLGEVLEDRISLSEAVFTTSVPNLSFLCAGNASIDPTDLLSQKTFEDFFTEVKQKFQRVIIDVPSILEFNDVFFWGARCDGMIDVIGAGVTPLKDINAATKKLEGRANIIGGVLNNVSIEKDFNYYQHYFHSFLKKRAEIW